MRRAPMRWSRIRGSPSSRGPATHRRQSGRRSSTASSSTSSPARSLAADPDPPAPKQYTGPEYRALVGAPLDPLVHPDPKHPPRLYKLIRRIVRWLVLHLFRITVAGVENIPDPPYIIAANHQAWFDPAFIIPFFPEAPMIYTMAKRETVFNRAWKRRLLPLVGVFPISPHRGELDEAGLRTVYQILERGGVVLIFPEGRYSRGRALRPLKVGIGHFALQAGVPISPVAVRGTDVLRPFSRIDVNVGPPVRPDPPAWWTVGQRVAQVVENVQRAISSGLQRRRTRRPER
ncbi:MAG: 1-acyl-sn-glycerol-3-phosphate acyltransferase [Chloroflexi bacterium]|nr:MAG: 1-acyl-sn-glycerol-3-phosphate acyltransferase [Chloroflexota bacterium]